MIINKNMFLVEARKLEDLMLKKEGGYLSLPKPSSVPLVPVIMFWVLTVGDVSQFFSIHIFYVKTVAVNKFA